MGGTDRSSHALMKVFKSQRFNARRETRCAPNQERAATLPPRSGGWCTCGADSDLHKAASAKLEPANSVEFDRIGEREDANTPARSVSGRETRAPSAEDTAVSVFEPQIVIGNIEYASL